MKYLKTSMTLGLLLPSLSWADWSDQVSPSRDDFGGIGLMQMPTARMAPDGDMSLNYTRVNPYIFGAVNLQPLSWLNTSIRYVNITNRLYGPKSLSGDQSYKDKGIDVKFRLWRESYYVPDIAVGLQDIGGTGLFASEYINATKRIGPVDITLGLAWGYLGAAGDFSNPACHYSEKFCARSIGGNSGTTGKFNVGDLFNGESVGVFGGIEYQTPWQPLILKLEYDGNNYQHEPQSNNQVQNTRFNFGAVYQLGDHTDVKLSYERGNTLSFGFTFHFNAVQDAIHFKHDPAPVALNSSPIYGQGNNPDWNKVVDSLANNGGIETHAIYKSDNALTIVGEQTKYRDPNEANDRIAAIANNATDDKIHQFRVVETQHDQTLTETRISRDALKEKRQFDYNFDQKAPRVADVINLKPDQGEEVWNNSKKQNPLSFSVTPGLTQSMGGPDGFYLYKVTLNGGVDWRLTHGLYLGGSVSANMLNNYDNFKYDAPSNLPRVRTYIREYLTTSKFGMNDLQLTWFGHPATNWYTQIYGGYLEFMYAGVGGEILYRPLDSRWAIGTNINAVRQRDFDERFGLRDYQTVTGHVSLYYQTPFDGITAQLDIGQYLAKDKGGTLTLTREFDNGFRIGAYATLTNVSAEQYGEGSFTKGVFVSFPLDQATTTSTVKRATINWVPLTRDGGQQLRRKYNLYDLTEQRGFNEVDKVN